MDDGDGAYTMELQAAQIARNTAVYRGSAPCPQCGGVMNPVEYMYSKGLCTVCHADRMAARVRKRLA